MILKAEHIAKSFRKKKVLEDINLELAEGTLNGIVGENGSGKSTLLKIIVGQWKADRGRVRVKGKMGYCPQKALLFSHLSVDEHFRYFAKAYDLRESAWRKHAEELLEHFQFGRFRSDQVAELSGGTQQKLNLSLALLHQPGLLILDEPYNGFDWETYQRFWSLTESLLEAGTTLLVVTHLLNETARFDRIYNLKNGFLE